MRIDIGDDWNAWRTDFRMGQSVGQLADGRLHEGRVKGARHGQWNDTHRAGLFRQGANPLTGYQVTGNDDISWAKQIGNL